MNNKELRQKAQNYIEENNIQKNTYAIEKAFIEGAKMMREKVKNNVVLADVMPRSCSNCKHHVDNIYSNTKHEKNICTYLDNVSIIAPNNDKCNNHSFINEA